MKKIISFALILVLLLVGCTVAPTESDMIPESAESDNSTTSIIVNDWWTTPIFFGEWEVKRVIPGGRFTLDKQEALEQLVGETVTFANNVVCLGDALLVFVWNFTLSRSECPSAKILIIFRFYKSH